MALMSTSISVASRVALVALGLCCSSSVFAQSSSAPVTVRVERPLRPLPRPLTDDGSAKPFLQPPVEYGKLAKNELGEVGAAETTTLLRSSVDPTAGSRMTFESVPGGVVFGLSARFSDPQVEREWRGSRLERGDAGWTLRSSNGRFLVLPTETASFVSAAYAFASNREAGDWLVDIAAGGEIHLSYPLKDSDAGMVVARADLAPQLCMPIYAGGKSLIVDRDVRMSVAGERLAFEADLEVRFYRPERNPGGEELAGRVGTVPLRCEVNPETGVASLIAPEGPRLELMASYLERLSGLAGWVGFFRWARASEVEGLAEFASDLAARARPVATPVKIDRGEAAAWVSGGAIRTPAEIPDWMREHRKRLLAD